MVGTLSLALAFLPAAFALGPPAGSIKNIVTFGDSYTDVGSTGDNGTAWPVYVADYGHLKLFPFARSGATCSNNLTFRPFPPVFESQIPTFLTEVANGTLKLNPSETIYTLWIGTNDIGSNALLTGGMAPGVSLVDVVECSVNWIKVMFQNGARNFIFQNMIPLEKVNLYSPEAHFSRYWTAQRNATEWSLFIREMSLTGNALSKLMIQNLAPTLKGAHVGYFDSHTLFTDMINEPHQFFNGTVPPNVTGSISDCVFKENENTGDTGDCQFVFGPARDSYLWYDELHPSEQTDRNVARQITNAIQRKPSPYISWFS